jgi:hypothetical protein
MPRFNKGTLVAVLAGCFDDKDQDDESQRWSSKFANGSRQELYGVIDKVFATRCDVYFFSDKMTTKVNLEDLILKTNQQLVIREDGSEWKREGFCRLVPIDGDKIEKRQVDRDNARDTVGDSAFDFNDTTAPIRIMNPTGNQKRKRKSSDPDILTIKPGKRSCSEATVTQVTSLDVTDVPEPFEMVWPQSPSPSHVSKETSSASASQAATTSLKSADLPTVSDTTAQSISKVPRTRLKKVPIYKRPVKNLLEAEIEGNYDSTSQEHMPERVVTSTIKLGTTKDALKRKMLFSTKRNKNTRRSRCDLIIGEPGPTAEAKGITEPLEAFDYYFPQSLQTKIVSFVNKRIVSTLQSQTVGGNHHIL